MVGAPFIGRSPKAKAAGFDLYNSLLFIGKPDLSPYGLKRSRTVYEHELWPPKRSAIPDEAAARSKARAVLAEGVTEAVPVILDVEQYSVDVRLDISHINPDTSSVDANILKLEQIIGWFKNEAQRSKSVFSMSPPLLMASLLRVNSRLMMLNWLYGRGPTRISFHSSLKWMRFIHPFIQSILIRQNG
jgi:hypothetical protein